MFHKTDSEKPTKNFRDVATERISQSPIISPEQTQKTLEEINHELQVHQIQLEIQNEELKKAHLSLEVSRDRYIDLYDFSPVGYFSLSSEALIEDVNLTGATMLGEVRTNLVNNRFKKFVTSKSQDLFDRFFLVLLNKGKRETCDVQIVRKDGTRFFARIEGIRVETAIGHSEIRFAMSDVSECKRLEEDLRESEAQMTAVFQKNPVAFTIVSATNGTIISVNEAFCRNTGYTSEDVIGKTSEELGLFIDIDEYEEMINLLKIKNSFQDREMRCRIKTGETRYCLFSSSIIMIGSKPHILSTVEDITEQKTYESAFNALIMSMVETTGHNSLQRITENVSTWLGADCVMIGEIQPGNMTVKVISMLLDGKDVSGYSYTLNGTPCDDVYEKGFCIYHDNVAQFFGYSQHFVGKLTLLIQSARQLPKPYCF